MKPARLINALFLDIGGVLLTNGWDHHPAIWLRRYSIWIWLKMNGRHHLTFDTYEVGYYLDLIPFPRPKASAPRVVSRGA
jgi:putative hydrolase of the HAD superfamily